MTIIFRNIPGKKGNETIVQKSVIQSPAATPVINNKGDKKEKILADDRKPVTQSLSKKKSIQKEKASEQTNSIIPLTLSEVLPVKDVPPVQPSPVTENAQPVSASNNTFDIRDVFTEEEWSELQRMSRDSESSLAKRLAKAGMNRLGELTGVQVQLPNREKQQDVFAFSVGNFEVRHVSAK